LEASVAKYVVLMREQIFQHLVWVAS
jgi:hypothetical protein